MNNDILFKIICFSFRNSIVCVYVTELNEMTQKYRYTVLGLTCIKTALKTRSFEKRGH